MQPDDQNKVYAVRFLLHLPSGATSITKIEADATVHFYVLVELPQTISVRILAKKQKEGYGNRKRSVPFDKQPRPPDPKINDSHKSIDKNTIVKRQVKQQI